MTNRMAEIEARAQQDVRRLARAIFRPLEIEDARLDINDKRWLIARVKELETELSSYTVIEGCPVSVIGYEENELDVAPLGWTWRRAHGSVSEPSKSVIDALRALVTDRWEHPGRYAFDQSATHGVLRILARYTPADNGGEAE